jgi:hypothetical protein
MVEWEFHQYEAKIRKVATAVNEVLREAVEGNLWREEPIDLSA